MRTTKVQAEPYQRLCYSLSNMYNIYKLATCTHQDSIVQLVPVAEWTCSGLTWSQNLKHRLSYNGSYSRVREHVTCDVMLVIVGNETSLKLEPLLFSSFSFSYQCYLK